MGATSDPDLLVLHGLRLKSVATAAVLADLLDDRADQIEIRLDRLRDAGWARYRDGVLTGWMLTPRGRIEERRRLRAEIDAVAGGPVALERLYHRFLILNQPLLQCCTDWQLRPTDGTIDGKRAPELNDHTDAAYDTKVVAALRALDTEVQPICADLARLLDRFGGYGARLSVAVDRTAAGEPDWFTKPVIGSYHTVWFELHEDLLSSLGLDRAGERVLERAGDPAAPPTPVTADPGTTEPGTTEPGTTKRSL